MILTRFGVIATGRELEMEVRGLELERGSGIEREVGARSCGRLECSSARSAEYPGLHRTVESALALAEVMEDYSKPRTAH
jgi:hypothetical protein